MYIKDILNISRMKQCKEVKEELALKPASPVCTMYRG